MRRIHEKHLGGEVLHLVLPMQVTFLNQRMLTRALDEVPRGGHVLLDAQQTEYIDPDVLETIRTEKQISDDTKAKLKGHIDAFAKNFA